LFGGRVKTLSDSFYSDLYFVTAVTGVIPVTSQIEHLRENIAVGYGRSPDEPIRKNDCVYKKPVATY
jgi:hypothetical protein